MQLSFVCVFALLVATAFLCCFSLLRLFFWGGGGAELGVRLSLPLSLLYHQFDIDRCNGTWIGKER